MKALASLILTLGSAVALIGCLKLLGIWEPLKEDLTPIGCFLIAIPFGWMFSLFWDVVLGRDQV